MSELRINWKNLLLVVPLKNGSFLDRDYLYKYGDINDIYKKSFFSQNIYIKKFFYNNSNRNDIDTTKLYNAADLEEILWNIGNIEISFKTLKKITGKGSILTSCIKRMIASTKSFKRHRIYFGVKSHKCFYIFYSKNIVWLIYKSINIHTSWYFKSFKS